jgi:hypothetical protein
MDSQPTPDSETVDGDRRALLAAAGAVAAGGVVTVPAAADAETTATDSTSTPTNSTTNQTTVPSREQQAQQAAQTAVEQVETDSGPTYLARVSDSLRVVSYDVAPSERLRDENAEMSRVTVTLEADSPVAITKTDAFAAFATRGVNQIPETTEAVAEGRTQVSMRATVVRGVVGMGISTDRGGVGISSGVPSDDGSDVGLLHGIATGIATAVVGTAAAAWRRDRDDLHEPEDWGDDDSGGGLL